VNSATIFEDKQQEERTLDTLLKDAVNRKHWPKAWERHTEACTHRREHDHCGWTGRPTKGKKAKNKHIVQHSRHSR